MPNRIYPAVVAFDCDDTLAINGAPFPGPVALNDLAALRANGVITGICGNFLNFYKYFPDGWKITSFYGPQELTGTSLLAHHQYKHYELIRVMKTFPAEAYVLVGNRRGDPEARPGSQDDVQAKLAGWKFISEKEWAAGKRW